MSLSHVTLVLCVCLFGVFRLQAQEVQRKDGQRLVSTERKNADVPVVKDLIPLKPGDYIMYWRPQKVGSSTFLSLLMSYSFRYNFLPRRKSSSNAFCRVIADCAMNNGNYTLTQSQTNFLKQFIAGKSSSPQRKQQNKQQEEIARMIPHMISLTHEICSINSSIVNANLQCAFDRSWDMKRNLLPVGPQGQMVKEVFQVRDPVDRAVSAYYFWGELYKLVARSKRANKSNKGRRKKSRRVSEEEDKSFADQMTVVNQRNLLAISDTSQPTKSAVILGSIDDKSPVDGSLFKYHGDENSVPEMSYAMAFAKDLPLFSGMPGPSFTWSAFANSVGDAIQRVTHDDRLMTIVLERLEESLVMLRHHLNWSLADIIYVKPRKSLSSHPKAHSWPQRAISKIRSKMEANGEYAVYNSSRLTLDRRIQQLQLEKGVNVTAEIEQFRILRRRVTEVCLDDNYLQHYRRFLSRLGLPSHPSDNKLRDVEEKYLVGGHIFSFNREILCSFDVCGGCEAHAMLQSVNLGLAKDLESALLLRQLPLEHRQGNVDFKHCPIFS